MNRETFSKSRRGIRVVVRILIVFLISAVALGLTLWRAPIWVDETLTAFRLSRDGIHSHSMMIDGYKIHYIEGGEGQPIVLLHGLGSQAQRDWSELAPYLVHAGYHVYALDLLGFGQSAKPADRTFSIPEQAKFVESFLNANHLTEATLGGFSMGGWIASTIALDQPQRVSRLMLFDSGGMSFKLPFDPLLFTPQTSEQVDQFLTAVGEPRPMPEFVKSDFIRMMRRNSWVVQRAWASMFGGSDFLDQRFSTLKMPVLIVWGKQDRVTPPSLGESMHRAAPQSVLAVYDGCGHIAPATCADRIAPTALAFLSGAGLQPGQTIELPAPKR